MARTIEQLEDAEQAHRDSALARINAALAMPVTHVTVVTFSDGTAWRVDARSLAAAESFASRYLPLVGKHEYISRETGDKIKIATVKIVRL